MYQRRERRRERTESQRKKKKFTRNSNRLADEDSPKTNNEFPSRDSSHKQEVRQTHLSVATKQAILLELTVQ